MALGAAGAMQVAFEKTLRYALERQAFGRSVGHFQVIRHKLAEVATTIEAGRDLTYHALRSDLAGGDAVKEVTMAKLATQRASFDVMDTCWISTAETATWPSTGSRRGRRRPFGTDRWGTDEIMKEVLGRSLGLEWSRCAASS